MAAVFSGDGVGVVGGAGAVRGADLDQGRAGVGEDVGDAESAADLDGLAARNDHFGSRELGRAMGGQAEE